MNKKTYISLIIMIVISGLSYLLMVSFKPNNQNINSESIVRSTSEATEVHNMSSEGNPVSNVSDIVGVKEDKAAEKKDVEATTSAVIKNTVDKLALSNQKTEDKSADISKDKTSDNPYDNTESDKKQIADRNDESKKSIEVTTQRDTEASVQSTTEALVQSSTERNVQKLTEENGTEESSKVNNPDTPKENNVEKISESPQKQPEQSVNNENTEPVNKEPVCNHRWVWATHTETVHHDAVYEDYLICEAYDENVYETHTFCNNCNLDMTIAFGGASSSEAADHMLNQCGGCGYHSGRAVVGTIHHDAEYGTICTALAYDEYIEVNDYEYCSICGEKK